jgi:UDP-2,3-diacylglucosamine pyrophosphatase LpxH
MRALAISDMHFGAWTGDPLLARRFSLSRLAPQLDDLDELILLGDVFDLLFSSVEYAFGQSEPFFNLLQRKMRGKRVVYLAGNHDHHIVVRTRVPPLRRRWPAERTARSWSGRSRRGQSRC